MLSRSPVMLLMTVLFAVTLSFAAGAAQADTRADTITIKTPVTSTALGGAGGERLSVTADSATPLTSMTVHVLSVTAGAPPDADTLHLAMQPPPGGARAGLSTWTSPDITPRVLPLGGYTLTVDAADQGGAAVSGVPAGAFPFRDTPRITAAAGDYVISRANEHPLIGGSITLLAPGASRPAPYADQPIVLHDPAEGDFRLATNGAGAYREALPRPVAGETITAEVPPTPTTTAAQARPVTLTVRTAVTGFGATLDPYWQVSYHGCLGLAPGTPGYAPPPAGLVLQYSAGPRGPWHVLGPVPARPGRPCGDDGQTFAGVLTARLSNAYYRASYPGAATGPEADGDLASVSATAHAWKYVTRVARFTVSARTVPSGGRLTVHGRLQCHSGTGWHDLARQVVQIILRPQGSRTWYWIARVTTSATGFFSATFTDPVTATWSAEYLGDRTHLAAVGAMITVTLK